MSNMALGDIVPHGEPGDWKLRKRLDGKEYHDLTLESLTEKIGSFLFPEDNGSHSIKLYTGTYGMDMFSEELEFQGLGKRRVYIGMKVLRILRRLKTPILRSKATGRYYKLLS